MSCILAKCGGKAAGCQLNKACSKTLNCNNACASGDLDCSEQCVTRFGTPQFDDLTVCIQANKCITPYPRIDFIRPQKVSSFGLADFQGTWYTLAGLDKVKLSVLTVGLGLLQPTSHDDLKAGLGKIQSQISHPIPRGPKDHWIRHDRDW